MAKSQKKISPFAARLRRLRLARGLTLEGLASLTGLSKMGIAKLEWGDRLPRMDTTIKLADALGITLDELLR